MCLFSLSSSSYMNILSMDRFESLLFKLEVLDHKARERAGLLTAPLGSPIPVLLRFETAIEVKLFLGSLCIKSLS
jgi:hypothetical protein